MLTTLLIFVPIGAAVLLWLLPLPARMAASLGFLAALVEVGLWIVALQRFEFGKSGLQFSAHTDWSTDLGVSYRVGMYGFSLWLVGLAVVVGAAAVAYGFWAGRERSSAYFGAVALPDGLDRRRLHRAGSPPLLRLLRGDADPALRADRRLGRAGAARRDDQVRHLHGGRLATDAGGDHRARAVAGDFDLTALGTSANEWIFFGFVAAFAVKAPLFPLHGWLPDAYRESPPEVAAVLSGVVSKAAAYGFLRIVMPIFPGPVEDWQW